MDNLTEEYVKRGLQLMRAAEGDALLAANIFNVVAKKVAKDLEEKYGEARTMAQINIILDEIKNDLANYYFVDYPKELNEISFAVVSSELKWNEKTITTELGEKAVPIRKSQVEQVIERAAKKPYQGKTFDEWLSRSYVSNSSKVEKTLRLGFTNGTSISDVVAQINGITKRANSDTKALTRSFFMHNAAEAKQDIFKSNPEVIEGSVWCSILDSRTTPLICGIRDQKLYDSEHNPVGHDLPWIGGPGRAHFCCRSIEIPKIIGDNSSSNRPQIGAGENYKRGDNETRNGTVRKPNKDAREKGIFSVSQTTTETSYESFLRQQAQKNIDYVADILNNKEDAILFRDGKVTLLDLAKENPVFNPTSRNHL